MRVALLTLTGVLVLEAIVQQIGEAGESRFGVGALLLRVLLSVYSMSCSSPVMVSTHRAREQDEGGEEESQQPLGHGRRTPRRATSKLCCDSSQEVFVSCT